MRLCNFCAAGNIVVQSLHLNWERGIGICGICGNKKSCMEVDKGDKRHWVVKPLGRPMEFLKKEKAGGR